MGNVGNGVTAALALVVGVSASASCNQAKDVVGLRVAALSVPTDVLRTGAPGCNVLPNPPPEEVYVFTDPGYRGACRVLVPGFYPDISSIGLEWIGSMKVGSAVRVIGFLGEEYSGQVVEFIQASIDVREKATDVREREIEWFLGGIRLHVISSLRVEDGTRAINCSDTRPGEIRLANDVDCVNVLATHQLANEAEMGIRNDSLEFVMNLSGQTVNLFTDANFANLCLSSDHPSVSVLSTNCKISSVSYSP